MSQEELHDLLVQIKKARNGADMVDGEYYQRLDEIVESLEQQRLYPDSFDQYSNLRHQIALLIQDYEDEHPAFKALLEGVHQIIKNFRI